MAGPWRSLAFTGAIWMLAACVAAFNIGPLLASLGVDAAFTPPDISDSRAVLLYYGLLPRLAMSIVCGFALGLSGTLLQHVLHNPLASPSTIGIEAGAQLALAIMLVWFPALLGWNRDLVTAFGGFAAMLVVFSVAWRFQFNPVSVILVGLVLGLYCSAMVMVLAQMKDHYLTGLFIWGGGSLNQNDWREVGRLAPKIMIASLCAYFLARQLSLLTLGEAARSLGMKLPLIRASVIFVAVTLTAFTVSSVGMIGFLGLAAPVIARATGARHIRHRLALAPLIGAGLLLLIDQLLQLQLSLGGVSLPTGAVTALAGVPILMLVMLRGKSIVQGTPAAQQGQAPSRRPGLILAVLVALVLAACVVAIMVGRDIDASWTLQTGATLESLLQWRWPRLLAAISAGVLLAVAGSLLQRLTGNPMASPEVLGVSAGTAIGLLGTLFLVSAPDYGQRLFGGFLGAAIVLALLLAMSLRKAQSSNQFLIIGVSLGAFLTALFSVILASGDPRAASLLNWMVGSTYATSGETAVISTVCAAVALSLALLFTRPLQLYGLGEGAARSRGVNVRLFRALTLGFAALSTAIATLAVGPLSFVGLMAPHLAQKAGLVRGVRHIWGSALFGALLMAVADFIGRTIYFPWQLPTGLTATLLGGPIFAFLLLRSGKTLRQN
jgi:ferric hydroxamate transport system permease protein